MATTPTAAAGTATDAQVRSFMQANYPSYMYVLGVPELYQLFKSAIIPGTGTDTGTLNESSAELTSKLQATTWWKQHGDSIRQYINQEQTDPASLNDQIRAKDAEVHQVANTMGLADNQVNIDQFARNALMFGWNNAELQEQLAAQATYSPNGNGADHLGTIDNTIAQLKQTAASYMVTLDDQTAFTWARDVAAGHHAVTDYTPQFISWAKGKFPTMASAIDMGITPLQTVQPLQSEIASLLELPSKDQVDFNDPKFAKVISYTDPKTNAPRIMTSAETQQYVRSMDDWKHTKQGQQAASDMTEGILNMFGKRTNGMGTLAGPSNAY